jgi:putative DNA primase/helicase
MSAATSVKPQAPTPRLDSIPVLLQERPQWVGWRYEHAPGRAKPWTKVPIDPKTIIKASSTNPLTWAGVDEAIRCYEAHQLDGIGYVLTLEDALVGIDLDGVCHAGALDAWAQQEVMSLSTYTEISPSGQGLRLFVRGTLPRQGVRHGPVEAYLTARFLTLTGQHLPETPATIEARDLQWFCERHFPHCLSQKMHTVGSGGASAPVLDRRDYQPRLQRMLQRPKVALLWAGQIKGYPSRSEADQALCAHLAFWFNGDREAMDWAFRRSALDRPEKWERASYREKTIDRAIDLALLNDRRMDDANKDQ